MNLYQHFERAAKHSPSSPCLHELNISLSYGEGLVLVNKISISLYEQGIGANDVVAVYADKSTQAVLVFLALSRLGACCLTLDTAFPASMIDYVLESASVKLVVSLKEFPCHPSRPMLNWEKLTAHGNEINHDITYTGNHLAWLVYSSGTTGKPKGVKITSEAMVGSKLARAQFSGYLSSDKVACNIYFYWEVFRPLMFGACSVVVSDLMLFDLESYQQFIASQSIDETLWTPSFAEMLLANLSDKVFTQLASLKRVWLNGEVVSRYLAELLCTKLPNIQFYNLYSISETFDVSARQLSNKSMDESFTSIGRAFSNVECRVLDEQLKQCSIDQQGELYLTSPYLAEGYLNQPEAEARAFFSINGQRYFKTKDVAYQKSDGEIFIKGRNDHVVKLRGYNVSLMAIESTLKQVLPIKQCVVNVVGESAISQVLVAYLEPYQIDSFINQFDIQSNVSNKLQKFLMDHLPHYAIPTRFACREKMNFNAYSSKLDRKGISSPKTNKPLAALWAKALAVDDSVITEDSDLMAMGANSLQLIQLLHEIKKKYCVNLDITSLESHSTLKKMQKYLDGQQAPTENNGIDVDLELTFQFEDVSAMSAETFKEAGLVLATGCTGFVGAHWLAEVLNSTDKLIVCLVRSETNTLARHRLINTFQKYQLDSQLLNQRVQVLAGSITKPKLGLSETDWLQLTKTVEHIFHAAAEVNLFYSYRQLRQSIIGGTKQILTFALTTRPKSFTLISSDAVYPNQPVINQNKFLSYESFPSIKYGYAQAKWLQEKLLQTVAEKTGLKYQVFRLGNMGPATNTGVSNADDINKLILAFVIEQQIIPNNFAIEFTPIDKATAFMVAHSMVATSSDIQSISQSTIIDTATCQKYLPQFELEVVACQQWQKQIQQTSIVLSSLQEGMPIGTLPAYRIVPPTALFNNTCTIDKNFLQLLLQQERSDETMA